MDGLIHSYGNMSKSEMPEQILGKISWTGFESKNHSQHNNKIKLMSSSKICKTLLLKKLLVVLDSNSSKLTIHLIICLQIKHFH